MKQFPQNSVKIGWPEWSQYNAIHSFIQVLLVAYVLDSWWGTGAITLNNYKTCALELEVGINAMKELKRCDDNEGAGVGQRGLVLWELIQKVTREGEHIYRKT